MIFAVAMADTDALNRAPETSYGEATGITQTVRNYAASLGLAIGTILVTALQSRLVDSFEAQISCRWTCRRNAGGAVRDGRDHRACLPSRAARPASIPTGSVGGHVSDQLRAAGHLEFAIDVAEVELDGPK
jgi:hypothetical protein